MALRVFYLDDEETLCDLFFEFLDSDNIRVSTFTDANESIRETRQNPPDVFFIDYRLKGTTGNKVAESVSPDIYKILVTGDLSVKAERSFQKTIRKPFSFQEIQDLLSEFPRKRNHLSGENQLSSLD